MKVLIFIAAILVVKISADVLEEENEPSLCAEHKNPFAYTHCIKKRDVACQNGGFCGTCNENSCQSCSGNNCKTSCSGSGCNQCPTGNCCNGQNCNVCSGRSCCSSYSCNSCVNTCTTGCSTPACRNSCVHNCQNNSCCDKTECFDVCRNQCFGDHCYENCFKQCPCTQSCTNNPPSPPSINPIEPVEPVTPGRDPIIATPQPPQQSNQTFVIVNRPENKNPVNMTTIINLRNYINNTNVIKTPVNVTSVNHNHINTSEPKQDKDKIVEKCCIVVYPVHCYDISEHPYKRCIQKREKKCGEICTSFVVHVVHVPGPKEKIPVPFPVPVQGPSQQIFVKHPVPYPVPVVQRYPVYLPQQSSGCAGASGNCGYKPICHYTNKYPWISCTNYGVQNCGGCYVCGGNYNPGYCSLQTSCAGLCRGGLVNFGSNWQHDLLRFAPTYSNQFYTQGQTASAQGGQPQQVELPIPDVQQQQIDNHQQAFVGHPAIQQPEGYVMQQPFDLGAYQQFVMQQPADLTAQQQFVSQQQFTGQQPFAGVQQYVVQSPYELPQPVQEQSSAQHFQQPEQTQQNAGGN